MGANKLEKFTHEQVNRKDIHGAEYNPRRIDSETEKRLRADLRDVGLVQPVVVNRQTMNIVGGHQRVNAMDAILRRDDYDLTVAMIDVDEREEVKINILLNNPAVQGEWDTFKLADLKLEFDFNPDELGFNLQDALVLFDLSESDPTREQDVEEEPPEESEEPEDPDELGEEPSEQTKQNRLHAAAARAQNKGRLDDYDEKENDTLLTFVFPTAREKHEMMKRLGKDIRETHLRSSVLFDIATGKYNFTDPIEIIENNAR
ncbi:MAG: ParB N-terminal domain-containing protein [Spirochaetes bacterium]|nr:ParB N-terminal domain-containing protein [Spirochaetota bacterium]